MARSTPSRWWNHQASISGPAIFRISEGWITTPTFTQRCAPLRVMPNSNTATSSTTPRVYKGTATAISLCGGIWATTNRMAAASSMLRP